MIWKKENFKISGEVISVRDRHVIYIILIYTANEGMDSYR